MRRKWDIGTKSQAAPLSHHKVLKKKSYKPQNQTEKGFYMNNLVFTVRGRSALRSAKMQTHPGAVVALSDTLKRSYSTWTAKAQSASFLQKRPH